jgi:hypothetical protein
VHTPDVWTCAHSRTWMSFAFCYKKDIDALCMYICVCVFALRDGFRTNQHLIELFGPPASSESQSNKNYRPRWRINLKCNLLRATNERRRPVFYRCQKPQHASMGMRKLGNWLNAKYLCIKFLPNCIKVEFIILIYSKVYDKFLRRRHSNPLFWLEIID